MAGAKGVCDSAPPAASTAAADAADTLPAAELSGLLTALGAGGMVLWVPSQLCYRVLCRLRPGDDGSAV